MRLEQEVAMQTLLAAGTSEGAKKAWDTRGRKPEDMSHDEIHTRLVHTVTEHDHKESAKKFYNPNALGMYLKGVHEAMDKIKNGVPARQALVRHFNGPLLNKTLKSIGEDKATDEEQRF